MADGATGQEDGAREQAQQKAQEVTGQAQEKAQQAAGQAKDRVREQVDQRSTQAGEQVRTTATDIRSVGEQLREQGKDQPAKIADQVADRAEQVGGYLERSDGDTILRDVEDFGRRQPWAIALGGLALGFMASRMLKASSESRYEQSRSQPGGQLTNGSTPTEPSRTAATPTPAPSPAPLADERTAAVRP